MIRLYNACIFIANIHNTEHQAAFSALPVSDMLGTVTVCHAPKRRHKTGLEVVVGEVLQVVAMDGCPKGTWVARNAKVNIE